MVYTAKTATKGIEQQIMKTATQQVNQTISALQLALFLVDHLSQARRRVQLVSIAYEVPYPSLQVGLS